MIGLGRVLTFISVLLVLASQQAPTQPLEIPKGKTEASTVLGIQGSRFMLNGTPVFLLGFSYFGALGAPRAFVRHDLDDFQKLGFNWLRVWATWTAFGANVSAVDSIGQARMPFLDNLEWVVAESDRRGLVVDVTLTRGKSSLPGLAAHQQGVATLVEALKKHRNWYLDLGNERDVQDERFVPVSELKILREEVRRLDPQRQVTASFGGHDLTLEDLRDALAGEGLDFVCPHRPRSIQATRETESQTLRYLGMMKEVGYRVPILYQEPFRRGYLEWEPLVADFLADLRGALAGGAAGWCFHNGQQRNGLGNQPRRCFDLRTQRLFEQLDSEELEAVRQVGGLVADWQRKPAARKP